MEAIQIIKKLGGSLNDSYLEEGNKFTELYYVNQIFCYIGFLLEKKIGINQPKRIENARILIANTAMDADKIKVIVVFINYIVYTPLLQIFGSKVRVDSTAKVAEIELAEKVTIDKPCVSESKILI